MASAPDLMQYSIPALQTNDAQALLARIKAQKAARENRGEMEANNALPGILMGLGQGQPMDPNAAPAPQPGQNDAPPAGPNVSPMPAPPGAGGSPMPPPGGQPPMGGGAPNPAGGGQPQQPSMQGGNASPAGPNQMQRPGQGYELPDVIRIIKSQYPNISGEALKNVLTTINPLILTPQAKLQVEYMKYMMQSQKLPIMQENADSRQAGAASTAYNRFGMGTPATQDILNRMPRRGAPQGGAPMGPGASQLPTGNVPPVNASNLQPPPMPGAAAPNAGSPSFPTAAVHNANKQADDQGKANALWTNTTLPMVEQGLQSVDQARKAFADTDAFQSGGLAPEKRAYLAGVIADLTGTPEDQRAALTAQLQQKSAAELLINQIGSMPGGTRQTNQLRSMIQDAKMDPKKIPAANLALADSIEATLEKKRLEGNFKADWSNGPGQGSFDRNGRHAMEDAFEKYPLVTFGQGGVPTYNRANVKKVRSALDDVYNGRQSDTDGGGSDTQGSDTDGGIKINAPAPPSVGETVDGWTFKGGDPADQKNWAKAGGK